MSNQLQDGFASIKDQYQDYKKTKQQKLMTFP